MLILSLFQALLVYLTMASYSHYPHLTWSPKHTSIPEHSLVYTQQQGQTWGWVGMGCMETLVSLLSWAALVGRWGVVVRGEQQIAVMVVRMSAIVRVLTLL